ERCLTTRGRDLEYLQSAAVVTRRMPMAMVLAPANWMNFKAWDRYWSKIVANPFRTSWDMKTWFFEQTGLRYLEGVGQRQGHRILLAGNGISPEPFGFAHAGCEVTVVDVSKVACRFLASLDDTDKVLPGLFAVYDKVATPQGW